PSRPLRQAQALLHTQFAENLTLSQMAETVGVHPMHLARLFRQHCRCTLGDYVRQLRVDYACRELASSDASLVEIALARQDFRTRASSARRSSATPA
ncbi:MAG TPA: helix-turn-helix domain-containing protein, partial [Chthonomonadaceae bacterium]|nr:helix-turn-helix domain-containing protein [Chthonomonadaceae bacterium]